MATHMLCFFLLTFHVVSGNEKMRPEGFMDRLSSGMQYAKDFLSSESVALKVAEFVVKAFQTANNPDPTTGRRRPPPNDDFHDTPDREEIFAEQSRPNSNVDEAPSPLTPLKHLVRLFGLQPNQISAVAVNALVFVAQMISTFLAGPKRPPRPYRSDDPTTWILNKNSKKLQDLLQSAKNQSLPDDIEDLIKQQGSEEETSCIRLLVCKITPFVNKMQTAVFGDDQSDGDSKKVRGAAVMYRHLPTEKEINERSGFCEQRHRDCDLNE